MAQHPRSDEYGSTGEDGQPIADEAAVATERLAAVHLLLQSESRDVKIYDIALATAFEFLESGPKTTDEVLSHVKRQWPGAVVTRDTVEAILKASEMSGYTSRATTLASNTTWQLAKAAELELEASRDWAADTVMRCKTYLHDEARRALGEISPEQAEMWTRIVLSVLFEGVRRAFTANPRGFVVVGDSLIFPTTYDLQAMQEAVAKQVRDDYDAQVFLQSLVAAAMTPTTPFGNEFVHYLATGYILYAYVGRHDHPHARTAVGSLRGEVAILDTPILIRLLGDRPAKSAMLDLIAQAVSAGIEVRVHKESFTELESVLDGVEKGEMPVVAAALRRKVERRVLANTASNQVLRAWLSLDPPSGAAFVAWSEFRDAAKDLEQTLQALGVRVVPGPSYDFARTSAHVSFAESLKADLRRGPRRRGAWNIDHDAQMLTSAHEVRKANPSSATKAWPGAFIITPDSHLNPAYSDVVGSQTYGVALTPAQWGGIIANCSDPVGAETMAQAISREMSYETLLARGASIPLEACLEVARTLSDSDATTAVDTELLQLTFEEVIRERPDLLDDQSDSAKKLAAEALNRRRQRLERALGHQREATTAERHRSEREREVAVRVAQARAQDAEKIAAQEVAKTSAAAAAVEAARVRSKRLARALGCVVVAAIFLVAITALSFEGVLTGKGLAAAVVGLVAYSGSAVDFTLNTRKPLWEVVAASVVAVALTVLGTVLGGK